MPDAPPVPAAPSLPALPQAKLTGLDIVPERVAALPRPPFSQGICASMHDTGLPDKSFDAIVGGEVLEHLPPSLIDPTLCEFFRILTLRGRLILTTPNPGSLRFRIKGWSVLLEESHLSQHPPHILRLRLQMTGFRNIKLRGSGRSTRYYGTRLPLFAYGSYLCTAEKW
jgi:SAM-dependent methyltransferase